MLKATKSLSAGLRTLVIASAAEAPAEEKPVKDLRRFETLPPTDPSMGVPPSSSEGGVEAELSAAPEEPSALALQTAAYTAELLSHVERLKGRLTALEAINDEGARLQKALQQQEEEDSLKMMRFLRRQEEHYSVELVSKMKFVEEETERRVAREKEEEMDEVRALAGALIAHGGTSLAPSTSLACCQPSPPPVSPPPLQDEPRPSERCSHPPSHSSPVSHPLAFASPPPRPNPPLPLHVLLLLSCPSHAFVSPSRSSRHGMRPIDSNMTRTRRSCSRWPRPPSKRRAWRRRWRRSGGCRLRPWRCCRRSMQVTAHASAVSVSTSMLSTRCDPILTLTLTLPLSLP
jgi:hypothetical protein